MNGRTLLPLLAAALFAVLALLQFFGVRNDLRFNRYLQSLHGDAATEAGDSASIEAAPRHASQYGTFAEAVRLQRSGALAEAQGLFAEVDLREGSSLRNPVLFQLAENYVAQAVQLESGESSEQGIPLLELAKQNYRMILSSEPHSWPARENLARLLRMQPDAVLRADDDDDVMPERSPQAPVQSMGHDRLP